MYVGAFAFIKLFAFQNLKIVMIADVAFATVPITNTWLSGVVVMALNLRSRGCGSTHGHSTFM